jgi:predicted GIY-YIG superfamily endonuclease
VGWYCVFAAGGGFAYAGSSGRVEERLRRHFRGYSSVAARGLRPGAAYVLACTRSRSLALAWEAWLHKAHQPPYAAKTPAKRSRKPPHPPPGWYIPHNAAYEPSLLPPCGHEPPPPKLKPSAKTWDGVRDVGLNSQKTSVA